MAAQSALKKLRKYTQKLVFYTWQPFYGLFDTIIYVVGAQRFIYMRFIIDKKTKYGPDNRSPTSRKRSRYTMEMSFGSQEEKEAFLRRLQ